MRTKAELLVALIVATSALGVWMCRSRGNRPEEKGRSADPVVEERLEPLLDSASPVPVREAKPRDAPPTPASFLRVSDADGASLCGGELTVLAPDGSWVACALGADECRYVLACEASAFRACGFENHYPASGALPEIDADSGEIRIVLQAFVEVEVELLGSDGQPWGSEESPWLLESDVPMVVAAGTPLGGWLPRCPRSGTLALDGVYTRASSSRGKLRLTTPPPAFAGLVLGQKVLEWRAVTGVSPVRFTLPSDAVALWGDVSFRVADAAGEELSRAQYWIVAEGARVRPPTLPVDAEGRGRLTEFPPGDWVLGVAGSGRGEARFPFRLDPGQSLDLGTLRLPPDAYVGGLLRGDRAVDVSYHELLVWDGRLWSHLGIAGPYRGGKERDRFAVGQLPPGRVQLSLLAPGVALNPTPMDVVAGVQDFVLDVRPGVELVLRARRDGCAPGPAPTGLRLLDANAELVWSGPFVEARLCVLPGRYELRTPLVDGGEPSTSLVVPADGLELVVAR